MKRFEILIASDSNYEKVFAEIYYDKKFVALVSQENGIKNLNIEFPDNTVDQNQVAKKIDYDQFIAALGVAKSKLTGEVSEKVAV